MRATHRLSTTLSRIGSRFRSNTSGSVAAWSAVAFPVMIAGAAVSVDVGRIQAVDTDLQAAADALSRVGAAELDQTSDSIERARRAVNELLSNDVRGGVDRNVDVAEIRFLTSLPTPRYSADTSAVKTTQPSQAKYVEVRVRPKTVNTLFPLSISGKFASATLAARSVAGRTGGVCGSAPVFICNPFERDPNMSLAQAAADPDFQRRQITFVQGGQGGGQGTGGGNGNGNGKGKGKGNGHGGKAASPYPPGSFGWLDIAGSTGNSGARALADAIGMDVSDVCVSQDEGVYLRPGRIASMRHAVNTRFDIYEGAYSSAKSDVRFAPAANVVKGWAINENRNACVRNSRLNACEQQPNSHAMGLPRDRGTDSALGANVGDGDWDFTRYMLINHPGFTSITIEGTTYRYSRGARKFLPATPPSRYAMYRWEVDNNCVPGALTYGRWAVTPEEGLPQCHTHGASKTVEDRRIIQVAVLNCEAIAASGVKFQGRSGPLPVEGFVRVFITEPMGSGEDNVLRGEVVGLVDPSTDSAARDRVVMAQ